MVLEASQKKKLEEWKEATEPVNKWLLQKETALKNKEQPHSDVEKLRKQVEDQKVRRL